MIHFMVAVLLLDMDPEENGRLPRRGEFAIPYYNIPGYWAQAQLEAEFPW